MKSGEITRTPKPVFVPKILWVLLTTIEGDMCITIHLNSLINGFHWFLFHPEISEIITYIINPTENL